MATSIQERRQLERQARRRKIQRVARRIFTERGFAGATIEEIAKKSGLSVGAIYLYFKSKEELYVSLLLDSLELFASEVEHIQSQPGEAREQLRNVWQRFMEFAETFKEFHRVIMMAPRDLSVEVVAALGQAASRAFTLVEKIIDHGIAHGVYRPECKPTAAELMWASFLGLVALGEARSHISLPPSSGPSDIAWPALFETLERGLLA